MTSSTLSSLVRATAAEQAAALASGEVSSHELTQAHLDRVSAVDDAVHAFLDVDASRALADADAAEGRGSDGEGGDDFEDPEDPEDPAS